MSGPLLAVPVHLQDDPHSCGLACAQMTLCALGAALYQQTDLAPAVPDPVWDTSPSQLCEMINARRPDGRAAYQVLTESSVTKAMDHVAAALGEAYPAVVATGASSHWVVVHGLTKAKSGKLTIHLRNPEPDRIEAGFSTPLDPHAVADPCPDKDIANSGRKGGEVSACQEWDTYYLMRATFAPVKGCFVVIAPDIPVPKGGLYTCRATGALKRVTDTSELGDIAWRGFLETDLLTQPDWNALGDPAPPLRGAAFARVENLDAGDAYFLVLLENSAGVKAIVRVSESTGEFLGALLQPCDPLIAGVFSDRFAGGAAPGAPPPRLVWRYSRAALFSPFVPLVEAAPDGTTRYIRTYDGKRFDVPW